jgi:TPP-dependent pyruvate/acetoin dehydrogenase alpha subunit
MLCTYREHGHALARIDADVIMAEMYGKIEGLLGRGGSMHFI